MTDESDHRDDAAVVAQQWAECYLAFGTAQSAISDAVRGISTARTPAERDRIALELRDFFRRLATTMLAIADPESCVIRRNKP